MRNHVLVKACWFFAVLFSANGCEKRHYGPTPSIGFCNEWLLGSKYDGLALAALKRLFPPLYKG
jgi:hypothetical protein